MPDGEGGPLAQLPKKSDAAVEAENMLNNLLAQHNLKAQIVNENGRNVVYFTDAQGNALSENELLKRLNDFRDKKLINMKGKYFVLAVGLLKQGGLSDKEMEKINTATTVELKTFEANAKNFLKTAQFTLDAGGTQESGGEGASQGSKAYLISQKQWDEWWRSSEFAKHQLSEKKIEETSQFEVSHQLNVKKENVNKDITVETSTTETGTNAEQTVTIRVPTTGRRGGKGKSRGEFVAKLRKEVLDEIYKETVNMLTEMAKNGQNSLAFEDGVVYFTHKGKKYELVGSKGNVNTKAYKEFLFVNRNNNEVKKAVRNAMIAAVDEEGYAKIEEEAQEAYEANYGKGKKMSKYGFAIALSYGAVWQDEEARNKQNP